MFKNNGDTELFSVRLTIFFSVSQILLRYLKKTHKTWHVWGENPRTISTIFEMVVYSIAMTSRNKNIYFLSIWFLNRFGMATFIEDHSDILMRFFQRGGKMCLFSTTNFRLNIIFWVESFSTSGDTMIRFHSQKWAALVSRETILDTVSTPPSKNFWQKVFFPIVFIYCIFI